MIPFPFNENRFSFFVADNLLVGQLCTNPKSDRNLLSCMKVTQCSTSEIGDAPLYNPCSLPIQVMTTGPLPATSKGKSGLPRITGTCPWWWKTKFPATVMVFGVVSGKGPHNATSHLRSRLESQHQSVPGCAEECGDPLVQSGGRPWVWQQDLAPAHKSKVSQAWLQKECYDFVPFSHWPPPSPTWTRGAISFGHTSRTSPTWPPTTPKPARSPPSAEYSPSSCRCLWKRHAPSFVSRRWLRLKAAILNRCQLYYIIKLPELIFSIKVWK